jgi:metalloendopeptidase OMA1, mitochondrial
MFSRTLLRSLRSHPRIPTARSLPPKPFSQYQPSPILRRYESSFRRFPPPPPPRRPGRIIYTRFDPEHARNAKPLLTVDGIKRTVTSGPSKVLIILVVGSATIFYVTHLEEVPESGRKRFICFSEAAMEEQGHLLYENIMSQAEGAILPEWDARSRMVNRVMNRLIQSSGLENVQWEVHVINSNGGFLYKLGLDYNCTDPCV